jgi:hypothetical protein
VDSPRLAKSHHGSLAAMGHFVKEAHYAEGVVECVDATACDGMLFGAGR